MLSEEQQAKAIVGHWLVIRSWRIEVRQIVKKTPKLFKLGEGTSRYPTQISINARDIICTVSDCETAVRLAAAIAEIDSEFNKQRGAADEERNARVSTAREARDEAIAELLR